MFTLTDLQNLLATRPFQPFRLFLSDGGHVDVLSQEVVLPLKRFAVIGILDPITIGKAADRFTIVWYLHVTRHEMLIPGKPPMAGPGSSESALPTSA